MKKLPNIHPGEILMEEFLIPMEISSYRLAKEIGIPQTRVSEITKGHRRITADTALRLSKYFGNSPKFWLGLQDDYDIEEESQLIAEELKRLRKWLYNVHLITSFKWYVGNSDVPLERSNLTN
jgi:addiction module HigA family antidote